MAGPLDDPSWLRARFVAFGARAPVPIGYYNLCIHGSAVCAASSGARGGVLNDRVELDEQRLSELTTIDADVNRSIRPVDDAVNNRVADEWSVDVVAGDCEDYALTKKSRLLSRGWPASALLIALAKTPRGAEHAVLIVRTDRGDLVMDNLVDRVRLWQPGMYRWQTIQSSADAWTWNRIVDGGLVADVAPPARKPTGLLSVAQRTD